MTRGIVFDPSQLRAPGAVVSAVQPTRSPVHAALEQAMAAHRAGRIQEAEQRYRQMLQANPNTVPALHNLAMLLHQQGRNDEALPLVQRAVARAPGKPEPLCTRACILRAQGRRSAAVADFRRALDLRPDLYQAWRDLGNTFHQLGRFKGAVAALRRAVELRDDYRDAWLDLATVYRAERRWTEAVEAMRRVVDLEPDNGMALSNLGTLLTDNGELDEAEQVLQRARALRPDLPGVYVNLANVLTRRCRWDEAMALYDEALTHQPGHSLARFNRSFLLLRAGNMTEGWDQFRARWEWREFNSYHLRARFPDEPWNGEPLDGKRILIHYEQGCGDVIQFVRYIPQVAERGGRVVLEVQPKLARLMETVDGVEQVVPHGQDLPAFDTYCPLMNLPAVFGTTLETVPAEVPYLAARPDDVARWRKALAGDPNYKVGLAWRGSDRNPHDERRSMPARYFEPLLAIPGVSFYSLQVGRDDDLGDLPALGVTKLQPWLRDFADSAAATRAMDLVISVDTAAVHLAAALARPVWMLLFYESEWRWMNDRTDSPWYPTLRIFRQRAPGDWAELMERVVLALREHAAEEARPAADVPDGT